MTLREAAVSTFHDTLAKTLLIYISFFAMFACALGFGVVYNLKPELQDSIRDAFFSFEWEGTTLQEEFSKSGEEQFIEMNYKDFWDVIRKIDAANGVSYACE